MKLVTTFRKSLITLFIIYLALASTPIVQAGTMRFFPTLCLLVIAFCGICSFATGKKAQIGTIVASFSVYIVLCAVLHPSTDGGMLMTFLKSTYWCWVYFIAYTIFSYKNVDEKHLNNVILVGYTNKVSEYLNDCAVYVHPATTEGFGIAVTEAMQMHCPCVVANKGALPELISNGECGFVIDAFNPKEWAEKIMFLFDNIKERILMGENAYLRAKRQFSLDTFIKKHEELYNLLMK